MPSRRLFRFGQFLFTTQLYLLGIILTWSIIEVSMLFWGTLFGLLPLSLITGCVLAYESHSVKKEEGVVSKELFKRTLITFILIGVSVIFLGLLLMSFADNLMSIG